MFGFIKKVFITAIAFTGLNGYNTISMSNQKSKVL